MILRCPPNGNVIGLWESLSKSVQLGKGQSQRRRTGRSSVDSSAALSLELDRPVTLVAHQPLEVVRRLCLRWLQRRYCFTPGTGSGPSWSMSSQVYKMLSLRVKRKMHVGYLFGPKVSACQSEKFLNVGADSMLLKRTRMLVRGR